MQESNAFHKLLKIDSFSRNPRFLSGLEFHPRFFETGDKSEIIGIDVCVQLVRSYAMFQENVLCIQDLENFPNLRKISIRIGDFDEIYRNLRYKRMNTSVKETFRILSELQESEKLSKITMTENLKLEASIIEYPMSFEDFEEILPVLENTFLKKCLRLRFEIQTKEIGRNVLVLQERDKFFELSFVECYGCFHRHEQNEVHSQNPESGEPTDIFKLLKNFGKFHTIQITGLQKTEIENVVNLDLTQAERLIFSECIITVKILDHIFKNNKKLKQFYFSVDNKKRSEELVLKTTQEITKRQEQSKRMDLGLFFYPFYAMKEILMLRNSKPLTCDFILCINRYGTFREAYPAVKTSYIQRYYKTLCPKISNLNI